MIHGTRLCRDIDGISTMVSTPRLSYVHFIYIYIKQRNPKILVNDLLTVSREFVAELVLSKSGVESSNYHRDAKCYS